MWSVTGDLPDWFYRIRAPAKLLPYCILRDLSPELLEEALEEEGLKVPDDLHLATGVGLCVVLMGWSWGPYVAHSLMLALLEESLRPWKSRRLAGGMPTPQLDTATPVHWGYIDDFGVALLSDREANAGPPKELPRIRAAVRARFMQEGVRPHKETFGPGLAENLGVAVLPDSLVLGPSDLKLWTCIRATEYAASLPALRPKALARIIGVWTWFAMICRELLSILNKCYEFSNLEPDNLERPVWPSVRQELRCLVGLACYVPTSLTRPWSPRVFMTDASWMGQGVVERAATIEQIKRAAMLSENKGWVTRVDEWITMDRHENSLANDLDREMGDPVAEITAFARPTFVVLHLFAGRRRQGDLEHYIMLRAAELDVQVRVVSLDVQIDARKGDLSDPRVINFWMDEIRKGRVLALFAGPPCSTWSVARYNRNRPGPRPVRSLERPWGLLGLTKSEQAAVDLGNLLLQAALTLAAALLRACGYFVIEPP